MKKFGSLLMSALLCASLLAGSFFRRNDCC